MRNTGFITVLVLTLMGCSQKPYHSVEVENPEYRENTVFVSYEDITSPKFDLLREKYQLDTIFHGEKDELKRILLLRDWIRKIISINDFADHYPGGDYALSILDAAQTGQGFHCGHYMKVQNAIMNAYGYVTRCIGAGPGVKGGPDGHHGANEIWLNKYQKWFLSDAKYNHHFEKNDIPLSVLEIRNEYLKNKAEDIEMVKGPDRIPIEFDSVADRDGVMQKVTKERFAQTYTWIEWEKSNNRFTVWPDFDTELNMYQDDYFTNHTWVWDDKPHWAYNTSYMNMISDWKAIEWTPNTITSKIVIDGNIARIEFDSNTPNLKTYQLKKMPDKNWKDVPDAVEITLNGDNNVMVFRAVNLADVAGPEHKVVIKR